MDIITLKEYILKAKNLEFSCYQQKLICDNLEETINDLKWEQDKLKNYIQNEVLPDTTDKKVKNGLFSIFTMCLMGVFIGFVIGLIIGIIEAINSINPIMIIYRFFKDFLFGSMGWSVTGEMILKGITYGGGIGLVIGVFFAFTGHETKKTAQEKNKVIINENKKIEDEYYMYQKKVNLATTELKMAEKTLQDTLKMKEMFYSCDIVYKTYRDIIPISMFDEYLQSGRCSTLEGHEGAYNLYEYEKRMQLIFTKLDTIIEMLVEINDNQKKIAQEIKEYRDEAMNVCNSMKQSLNNLEQSSITNEYYNKITAQNTSYISWLNTRNYIENKL